MIAVHYAAGGTAARVVGIIFGAWMLAILACIMIGGAIYASALRVRWWFLTLLILEFVVLMPIMLLCAAFGPTFRPTVLRMTVTRVTAELERHGITQNCFSFSRPDLRKLKEKMREAASDDPPSGAPALPE